MNTYETLSQAVNGLTQKGYKLSFEAQKNKLSCSDGSDHGPDHFDVVEFYRFEGMSSAGDNAIVYAIETKDGKKGTLVDSYGAYAENLTPEMAKKMSVAR
ncbi:MAG TPA: hypothetical protein VJ953_04855 [Saprospiraceae bacterium]|nr:hypothetical protein [Saprospiraceae bacterium]